MPNITTNQYAEISKSLAMLPTISEKLSRLETCINGNGKKGLIERMTSVEYVLAGHMDDYKDEKEVKKNAVTKKDDRNWAIKLILIGQAIQLLVTIIKSL
jgi:hypothetical protein